MKRKRIIVKGVGVYHVFNRTAYSHYSLNDEEREMFVRMLRKQAAFCGIELLSYCVLSNHYHLLVRVRSEERPQLEDAELLARYRQLYQDDPAPRTAMRPSDLEALFLENPERATDVRKQLLNRMQSLPVFMKELQQRFGIWFNRTRGNKGTLWSERFRSVLIEPSPRIMRIVAAYIELNPVRAGMVDRPESFRWCSLYSALQGDPVAQAGIKVVTGQNNSYERALSIYVRPLAGITQQPAHAEEKDGETKRIKGKQRCDPAHRDQSLRSRIAAVTQGGILGTKRFITETREKHLRNLGWKTNRSITLHAISIVGDFLCSLRKPRKQLP